MNKWDDMYLIRRISVPCAPPIRSMDWNYELVLRVDNTVIGTYRDYHYAKNRAKYKFKQAVRSFERKVLLG